MEQNQPIHQTKSSNGRSDTLKITAIAIAAAVLIAGGVFLWQLNQNLQRQVGETQAQIGKINENLATIEAKIVSGRKEDEKNDATAGSNESLEGAIGEVIDTKAGSLVVNSYKRTSENEISSSSSSKSPLIAINLAIVNTSDKTQTYSWHQFTYINAAKTVISSEDINRHLAVFTQAEYLDSVTLEPGGSVETDVYFDKYDLQAGTLKWNASLGQEVRVTIPKL